MRISQRQRWGWTAGRLLATLPPASAGLAGWVMAGCAVPSGGGGVGGGVASSDPGGIAPSWTGPGAAPAEVAPAAGGSAGGLIDPIEELRRQRETQLASPARPVITPEVMWGEAALGAGAAVEPVMQVFETTVRSAEQRLDLTAAPAVAEVVSVESADVPSANLPTDLPAEPLYVGVDTLTQSELLDELHRRLTDMEAPPLRKALAASGLSLIRPGLVADASVRGQLDPTQAALLERFEKLLTELARRIEGGDLAELDAGAVAEAVRALQGPTPLSLRNATLCKRVSGFGVYEPFGTSEFIAGREHKAIIYAEVEDFATLPVASDRFEVKLRQEVTLFNEADGLAVWQQPAQPIQDVSQRKRRDFYNVQMITLPANLGVGKYRLKVRVTDVHGGTVDEATLPIQLIADDAARGMNTPTAVPDTPVPDLTDTQRDLLKTLAPGLFMDQP